MLVVFKAQLGEPFQGILIFLSLRCSLLARQSRHGRPPKRHPRPRNRHLLKLALEKEDIFKRSKLKSYEKGVLAKGISAESSVTLKEKTKIPKDIGLSSTCATQSTTTKRGINVCKNPLPRTLFLVPENRHLCAQTCT